MHSRLMGLPPEGRRVTHWVTQRVTRALVALTLLPILLGWGSGSLRSPPPEERSPSEGLPEVGGVRPEGRLPVSPPGLLRAADSVYGELGEILEALGIPQAHAM